MSIYYRHFTIDNSVKISHITLAGTFVEDKFCVALAFCSRKDMFSRKVGRKLAEYRLHQQAVVIPKSEFYKYASKYYPSIFKTDKLESHINNTPLCNFNINFLFEAAFATLIGTEDN